MTLEKPMSNRPIVLIGAGGIVESAHLPAYQKAGFEIVRETKLTCFDPEIVLEGGAIDVNGKGT